MGGWGWLPPRTILVIWRLDGEEVHRTIVDGKGLASIRRSIRNDPELAKYDIEIGPATEGAT
jgi:hypothetical protein